MSGQNEFIIKKISGLVGGFTLLEFSGEVWDTGRSMKFYITRGGVRKQCYQLCDEDELDEDSLEEAFDQIEDFVRKSTEYQPGEVCKIAFEYSRTE